MDAQTEKMGFLTSIKENAKIYGSIFAIAVFFFSFGHNAHATEGIMAQQTNFNCQGVFPNCHAVNFTLNSVVGTSFIASTTNISGIGLYTTNGFVGTSTVTVCAGGLPAIPTNADTTTAKNCGFTGNTTKLIAPNVYPTQSGVFWKYILPVTVPLEIGKPYYITVSPNATYNNYVWYWDYLQGAPVDPFTSGRMIGNVNQSDIAFRLYYQYNPNEINIFTPIQDFIYNTQFVYFGGYVGTGVEYLNIWLDNFSNGNTSRLLSHAPTSSGAIYEWSFVQKLEPANYQARYLYGGGGQFLTATTTFSVASTAIEFDLDTTGNFICPLFNQSCAITASTTIASDFYCYLQKATMWLLCPTEENVREIRESKDVLQSSFPFNAIFGILADVDAVISSTTATTASQTFDVPMIRKTATSSEFYLLPVLSTSSLSLVVGDDNASMIRTTLGYFVWIMTGAIIYLTVKI